MCFLYDDYFEIYKVKPVKAARKEHKCGECGRTIETGESYLRHFSCLHGEMWSGKACRGCAYIRQLIHDEEISAGCSEHEAWPPFGQLAEICHPNSGNDYACLGPLGKPAPEEFVITEEA